jgi:FlaA1/EpsC-like NDP-sugar epimerase
MLKGKSLLVTGGTGSFGKKFDNPGCPGLLDNCVSKVVALSTDKAAAPTYPSNKILRATI